MRILFATRDFPPDAVGGTEIYTQMLAEALQALGHEVSVLCVGDWTKGAGYYNGCKTETCQGVPVLRLHLHWQKAPDPNRFLYDNPMVEELVAKHLIETKPDVVHVTSCDRLSASVLRAVREAGVPLVLSLTDFWFLCPKLTLVRSDGRLCDGDTTPWDCLRCLLAGSGAYRSLAAVLPERILEVLLAVLSRQPSLTRHRGLRGMALDMADRKRCMAEMLRLPDYITIATPFGATLFKNLAPDLNVRVTPYGHDLSWLASYSGKTPAEELRIGFIGSLCEAKGADLLLEAFRRIPLAVKVRLLVYGDMPGGEFGRKLAGLAADDPRVKFLGRYAHQRSAEVYSNLDVLVIPSRWYDFPLVAHEALATRTVVVATDLPGLNEIVTDGVTGLLFERGNVAALAAQLNRLAESPALVSRLRGAARAVRTIEDAVAELESTYTSLLANRAHLRNSGRLPGAESQDGHAVSAERQQEAGLRRTTEG